MTSGRIGEGVHNSSDNFNTLVPPSPSSPPLFLPPLPFSLAIINTQD